MKRASPQKGGVPQPEKSSSYGFPLAINGFWLEGQPVREGTAATDLTNAWQQLVLHNLPAAGCDAAALAPGHSDVAFQLSSYLMIGTRSKQRLSEHQIVFGKNKSSEKIVSQRNSLK